MTNPCFFLSKSFFKRRPRYFSNRFCDLRVGRSIFRKACFKYIWGNKGKAFIDFKAFVKGLIRLKSRTVVTVNGVVGTQSSGFTVLKDQPNCVKCSYSYAKNKFPDFGAATVYVFRRRSSGNFPCNFSCCNCAETKVAKAPP